MKKFILKRLSSSLLILWGVLSLSFILLHLAPGDPSYVYMRPEIPEQTLQLIRKQMGMDLPLWQQYLHWLAEFSRFRFGISYSYMKPVAEVLKNGIINTLQLTLLVFVLQFLIGGILGFIMARRWDRSVSRWIDGVLIFLYSMPSFWIGLMLILLFSLRLGWLPSSQMQSIMPPQDLFASLLDRLKHLILPVTVLAIPFIASTTRMVAAKTREVIQQNYIKSAYAWGIPERKILRKYVGRNLLPLLANLFGLYLPFLLGGSVIVESIFGWPGMGRITVNALFSYDFPLILGSNFLAALAVVTGNFMADLMGALTDPRIRVLAE